MEERVRSTDPAEVGLSTAEVGHFEAGGRHFEGSPAGRATEAAMVPVIILGAALAADQTFQRYAAEVASNPDKAPRLAGRYCRAGAGRQVVEAMLREASRDRRPGSADRLMNLSSRRAWYEEAPLEPGDRRNALQERTLATFQHGAELLVRRGANRCLTCGRSLAHDHASRRYCASHQPGWGEEEADQAALRATLRAAAESMGFASCGPRARRTRRPDP
jgi:hypothetical protein